MTHSAKAALRGEPSYVWRSGQERRLGMVADFCDVNGMILDAGCGLGTYMNAFRRTSSQVFGIEIELDRSKQAAEGIAQASGERLPFEDNLFDLVFSNEVIEHTQDDVRAVSEMVRVTKAGGRIAIFCPNRWYPVEQHGIYWRGEYQFGNKPLVNYLPDHWRDQLAPHVRAYTKRGLYRLFEPLPVRVAHYAVIYGGYDNIERRLPRFGRMLKSTLYTLEKTPLQALGLSHFLVLEKRKISP